MAGGLRPLFLVWAIATASIAHSSDVIELVLDQSNAMWRPLPDHTPRIVAVRSAISAFIASPALSDLRTEVGLSTFGGRSDISESTGCEDVGRILPIGAIDRAAWSAALGDLDPRGGRPLVRAIEETALRLASVEGNRRIVVLTAGADLCSGDLGGLLDRFSRDDDSIEVRVIGIDLDQAMAGALSSLTPTRNASDTATLLGLLKWAMLPSGSGATRPELFDLDLARDGKPLNNASMSLNGPTADEEIIAPIDQGSVRFRLPPGRYGATISCDCPETIELTGLIHNGSGRAVDLALSTSPEVTLEVDPERPLAGDEAFFQFWGAPAGDNWLMLAVAGSPLSDFVVRSRAPGPTGEIPLTLPDAPTDLEVRFATDIGNGVLQLLGRIAFQSARRRISLHVPERAEIRSSITVAWSGGSLTGDHLMIDRAASDRAGAVLCMPIGDGGQTTVASPPIPGEYVVRYLSRRGQTVARSSIDIFEVLAELDGPTECSPNADIEVSWTGPDAEQDYLSIASVGEGDDQYRSFSPTSAGNPARLTAPKAPGRYELRYVRASDGEVLAREPLAVVAVELILEVPRVVGVGTRFEVSWTGTSGSGDFITVAREGSDPSHEIDSTYASLGSPVTLAAPFEAGRYVVRYISGASRQILAESPIEIR